MNAPATVTQLPHPMTEFRQQLEEREGEFRAALPAHIPAERFMRVVMTAVQTNPDLLNCNRRTLFNSAVKCAQDGLLPDGREAALVQFKNNRKVDGKWVTSLDVQYMPMIAGIRKKVRNSGEIATWEVHVVYENDAFEYELGDTPFIRHKPSLSGDRGKVIAAYSVATLKSGEKSREVMTIEEIEKVRSVSKAKDAESGPWTKWYDEMARKSVARRHAKVLPMSTDLDDLMRRDDQLYDFEGAKEAGKIAAPASAKSLGAKLDLLARGSVIDDAHDPETGEITPSPGAAAGADATDAGGPEAPEGSPASEASQDQSDPLLDEAREKAMDGRRVFDAWFAGLSPAARDELKPHTAALMKAANAADGRD
jgi:recombination protein RecT